MDQVNTLFTNLNTPTPPTEFGKPAILHFVNMGAFQNRRLEARVSVAATRRGVALFRATVVKSPAIDARVDGMTETDELYRVEVYTDDGNSGAIRAFRFDATGGPNGVEATFDGARPGPEVADAEPAPPPPAPL